MGVLDLNEILDEEVTIDNLLKFNYVRDELRLCGHYYKRVYGYFLDHYIPISLIRVQVLPGVSTCRMFPLRSSEALFRSELSGWQYIASMEDLMLFENKVEILINEEYGRKGD
jgi:hypothetical protein